MKRNLLGVAACFFLASCQTETTLGQTESRTIPNGAVRASGPILSYADAVDRVAPAVVTIRSSRRARAAQQFPFAEDPLFRQSFGGRAPREQNQLEHGMGSGVIVRADGYILTNHHVIDGAEDIKVDLMSKKTYSAKVVGSDPASDLALLQITASDLPVLQLGDSDKVRVGDVSLAVGNPLGIGESVTAGIISAKGRSTDSVGGGSFQDFLQTDAPINQGNSGGALVNTRGELIGINSQILSSNGGNIGIGFAIPSNMAKMVMDQLMSKGKVQRGMLGVGIQPVTGDLAASLGLKETRGVLVNAIAPGGPAEKAGFKTGDVILQLNGKDMNDPNVLRNQVAANQPGSDVTVNIIRNGKEQQIKVQLGTLTPQTAQAEWAGGQEKGGSQALGKLGLSVEPLTPDIAQQLSLQRGTVGMVVRSVDASGPAAKAGVREGDVIQEVNRQPVRSVSDLQAALPKSGDRPALLLINRGGQTIYVPVPLG